MLGPEGGKRKRKPGGGGLGLHHGTGRGTSVCIRRFGVARSPGEPEQTIGGAPALEGEVGKAPCSADGTNVPLPGSAGVADGFRFFREA